MESYQETNNIIRKMFRIREQPAPPFVGGYKTSRKDLAKLFNKLGYKVGAEIGVSRGIHAKSLCRTIKDLKLFLIDPWEAYEEPLITQERANERYNDCLKRLEPYNVEYMRMTSMDAVKCFENGSLDFVYIDGLHTFDGIMSDLIFWSPKVRSGGIVSGHDYLEFPQSGIIPAVRAYTTGHGIFDWYVTRDRKASFFWANK